MKKLKIKKVAAIIAGGSGMGADAALRLSKDGFRVAIMSSSGKAKKIAKKIGGVGFTGTNRSVEDILSFYNLIIRKWGRVDVLVNSAGHGPKGEILKIKDEDWIKGVEIYFLNVVRATRIFTPIMKKQKNGSIINISTYATFEPESKFPTSGVCRAGLSVFTKIYSDEYAKYNVRMNNILPGFIDSLKTDKEYIKRIPLRRVGKVREISSVVSLLASDDGAYINGQNLKVDGGLTRSV